MKKFVFVRNQDLLNSKLFERTLSREETSKIMGGKDDFATTNSCCVTGCDIQPSDESQPCYCVPAL